MTVFRLKSNEQQKVKRGKLKLHFYTMLFNKNFALCLHLKTNSERIFSSGPGFACTICSFLAKHRSQAFAPERNGVAC